MPNRSLPTRMLCTSVPLVLRQNTAASRGKGTSKASAASPPRTNKAKCQLGGLAPTLGIRA